MMSRTNDHNKKFEHCFDAADKSNRT
eukprot:COSAG01_NODE_59108_length_302_cov_0.753695_1_plen_25_part_10